MSVDGAALALTSDELGADALSARRARERVRDFLLSDTARPLVDPLVVDDVVLVVSELVTNVILHTDGPPAVSVRLQDHVVRVEVADQGVDVPVAPVRRRASAGGHGLRIVESVASQWGVERGQTGGKTVWAVCAARRADRDVAGASYV